MNECGNCKYEHLDGTDNPCLLCSCFNRCEPKEEPDGPEQQLRGMKFNEGKVKLRMMPQSTLVGPARVLMFGAEKYEPDNWKKGIPFSELMESHDRHCMKFWEPEYDDLDEESRLNHLDHAIINLMFIRYFQLMAMNHLDDRPILP